MATQSHTPSRSLRCSFMAGAIALAMLLSACFDDVWRGNVATINGTGITLDQMAALRNSIYFDWTITPLTEMENMRKQYGEALTNLLAVELVKQHLKRKKLEVSPEEVAAEEARIRADYPPGTFEQMIVDEAIDMESWRFLLLNSLSVRRFLDAVLRPNIAILPEEVGTYLKEHPEEFVRPPWVHFYMVSGTEKDVVEKCAKELAESMDPARVQTENPNALVRTVRMDVPRLPSVYSDELAKMNPGDLSPMVTTEDEFHQMCLVEKLSERPLEPGEAYLQIERTLLEQKSAVEYNKWIASQMAKANIKVASKLLYEAEQTTPVKMQQQVPAQTATGAHSISMDEGSGPDSVKQDANRTSP